jgi:outer membrane protein assembly factor BamA
MNSFRSSLLLTSALLLAGLPANSQTYQPKTIQFKGDPEYSTAELLEAAQFKRGASISVAEMNAKSQLLLDSGVFSDVAYNFNGQDLVFKISPASDLYTVRLENFPFAAGPELDKRLHTHLPLYHGLVPNKGDVLDGVKQGLVDELATMGIKATVAATPYTDMKLHKVTAISFSITDPDVAVGEIVLQGVSPAFADKAMLAEAKSIGSPYDFEGSPSQIETKLRNFYGEQGYLQAKATATPLPKPLIDQNSVRIPFTVSVEEGPQFKLGKVTLAAEMAVTQEAYDKFAGLKPGDIASGTKLRGSWEQIVRQYHDKGYLTAKVNAEPAYDQAKATVSYSVTAEPGPVYTMGRLKVENLSEELRETVTNAWKLKRGDVFNEGLTRSMNAQRGKDPELEHVLSNFNLAYSRRLNDDTHTVDVTIVAEPKHP